MFDTTYDFRSPLKSRPPPDHRYIGVIVGNHLEHNVGLGGASVDWESECPVILTSVVGGCVPAATAQEEAQKQLAFVIGKIDAAIAELSEHRDRLAGALEQQASEKEPT